MSIEQIINDYINPFCLTELKHGECLSTQKMSCAVTLLFGCF